jgi:hypothetical protein
MLRSPPYFGEDTHHPVLLRGMNIGKGSTRLKGFADHPRGAALGHIFYIVTKNTA